MPSLGRVILIDHRKTMHTAWRQTVEAAGFSIAATETGAHGLERVRQESFDVALLNLEIPDIPGIEVLKRLRQESPNTAIIVLFGNTSSSKEAAAIREGAFECLPEPFTPETLRLVEELCMLDHLSGGDLIDEQVRQEPDGRHGLGTVLGRRGIIAEKL